MVVSQMINDQQQDSTSSFLTTTVRNMQSSSKMEDKEKLNIGLILKEIVFFLLLKLIQLILVI